MRIRTLPALAILLTVMVAPVHAVDTTWQVSDTDTLALMANRPGARPKLQMTALRSDFSEALTQYQRATGGKPPEPLDLDHAGLLPFLPVAEAGHPMPFVALGPDALPALGTIGLRYVGEEIQIIAMGADGDVLSPLVERVPLSPRNDADLDPIAWPFVMRRLDVLDSGLRRRLRQAAMPRGMLPESEAEILGMVGWAYNPAMVRGTGQPGAGVLLEWDMPSLAFRTSWEPAPIWSPVTCGRFAPWAGSGGGMTLRETRDQLRDYLPGGSYAQRLRVIVREDKPSLHPARWPRNENQPGYMGMASPGLAGDLIRSDFSSVLRYASPAPAQTAEGMLSLLRLHPWLDWPVDDAGRRYPLHFRRGGTYERQSGMQMTPEAYSGPDRLVATFWETVDFSDPPGPGYGMGVQTAQQNYTFWNASSWPTARPSSLPSSNAPPQLAPEVLAAELDGVTAGLPRPWTKEVESAYVAEFIKRSNGPDEADVRVFLDRIFDRLAGALRFNHAMPADGEAMVRLLKVEPLRYRVRGVQEPFDATEIGVRIDREPSGRYLRALLHYGVRGEQWLYYGVPEGNSSGLPARVTDPLRQREIADLQFAPAYRFTMIEPAWNPEIVEVSQ